MQVHAALADEGFCYAIHSVGVASDQPRFDTPSPRSDLSSDLITWIFSLTDTGHNRDSWLVNQPQPIPTSLFSCKTGKVVISLLTYLWEILCRWAGTRGCRGASPPCWEMPHPAAAIAPQVFPLSQTPLHLKHFSVRSSPEYVLRSKCFCLGVLGAQDSLVYACCAGIT